MTQKKPPTPPTAAKSVLEEASEGLVAIGEQYLAGGNPRKAIGAFAVAGAFERLEPIARGCLQTSSVSAALEAYRVAEIGPPRDLLVAAAERLARTADSAEDLIAVYVALGDISRLVDMGNVLFDSDEYRLAAKAFAGAQCTIGAKRLLENIASRIQGVAFDDAYDALNAFPGAIRAEQFIAFGDRMRDERRYPAAIWAYSMGRNDAAAAERLFALGCTLLEGTQYELACHAFDFAERQPPRDLLVAYVLRSLAGQHADAAMEVYARIDDKVDPATHVVIADGLVACGYVRQAVDAYRRGRHPVQGETLTRICARLLLAREYGHLSSILREEDTASIAPGILVEWGNALLEQGQLSVAELAYEKAGAPLCAEEYIFCGQRLLARGNLAGATKLFVAARERALRAKPV